MSPTDISSLDPELRATIEKRQATLGRLKQIFIDDLNLQLDPDEIDPDAALFGSGLDLDSIDAVEIVTAVETSFNVRLRDFVKRHSLRTLNTLADAIMEAERNRDSVAA